MGREKSTALMYDNKYFSLQAVEPPEALKIILVITGTTVLGLFSVYLNPTKFFFDLFNIPTPNGCPLLTFTGIACPFCGMGRVFSCMTDLYITQSFYYNPLGLIFYILSGLTLGFAAFLAFIKRKIVFKKNGYKLLWLPAGFIILMWILNILYGHH